MIGKFKDLKDEVQQAFFYTLQDSVMRAIIVYKDEQKFLIPDSFIIPNLEDETLSIQVNLLDGHKKSLEEEGLADELLEVQLYIDGDCYGSIPFILSECGGSVKMEVNFEYFVTEVEE